MLLIPCPYCGPCAQTEFTYGSDASVVRPPVSEEQSASDAQDSGSTQQWLDHIYLRDNPRGPHLEWWQHSHGCRSWIKVCRDTATHEVLGAWPANETVPDVASVADRSVGRSRDGSDGAVQ
jgi:heterotetrameric sarcosine oxidase delta subunit